MFNGNNIYFNATKENMNTICICNYTHIWAEKNIMKMKWIRHARDHHNSICAGIIAPKWNKYICKCISKELFDNRTFFWHLFDVILYRTMNYCLLSRLARGFRASSDISINLATPETCVFRLTFNLSGGNLYKTSFTSSQNCWHATG